MYRVGWREEEGKLRGEMVDKFWEIEEGRER